MANKGKIIFWSVLGILGTAGLIIGIKKLTGGGSGFSRQSDTGATDSGSASSTPPYSPTPSSSTSSGDFPLVKGSRGENVKSLQRALGIQLVDGILGSNTETYIHVAGYNLPLSQSDFNKIVSGSSPSSVGSLIGKNVFARYDTPVYNLLSGDHVGTKYKTATKGEWVMKVSRKTSNGYYTDGTQMVSTDAVSTTV